MDAALPGSHSEHVQAVDSHARHFVALLASQAPLLKGAGNPDDGRAQAQALARLGQEDENLHTAFLTALDTESVEWLAVLARQLPSYLHSRNQLLVVHSVCTSGLVYALGARQRMLEAHFRLGLSRALTRQGNAAEALEHCGIAQSVANECGDAELGAIVLHCVGAAQAQLGEVELARQAQLSALELHRASADLHGEAIINISLGDVRQGMAARQKMQLRSPTQDSTLTRPTPLQLDSMIGRPARWPSKARLS